MSETQEYIQSLIKYINDTPELMSLLYDLNLLPEETDGSIDYRKTLVIADAWMNRKEL